MTKLPLKKLSNHVEVLPEWIHGGNRRHDTRRVDHMTAIATNSVWHSGQKSSYKDGIGGREGGREV